MQSVNVMNPQPTLTGNWSADLFFFAHPYIFGSIRTVDANGIVAWSPILNRQIDGATWQQKRQMFGALVERYRLSYLGVTAYHDASAVENNGLLACGQFMETLSCVSWSGAIGSTPQPALNRLVEVWPDAPRTFEQLQQLPNAYLGPAREGCYAPYRLSRTCQDWQSGSDPVLHANSGLGRTFTLSNIEVPTVNAPPDYPYGLAGPNKNSIDMIHRRADDGVIHIAIRNISANASFTLYIRSGWEYQVLPGTTLAPFSKVSPMYDPVALTTYYRISRELKDAYPASYNDLGKLLGIIGNVAKHVIGALIPAARVPLGLASAAIPVIKSVTSSGRAPSVTGVGVTAPTSEPLSAADKERLARKYRDTRPQKPAPGKRQPKSKGKARKK